MTVIAYIRVSTAAQDLESQRLAILSYAQKENLTINEFVDTVISTRERGQRSGFEELIERMEEGDTLILSELTRAGRSLQAIITHVNRLTEKHVNLISIKEGLHIMNGEQDLQAKITVALFGLLGEVERDLMSQRTKEGIAKAKANGKQVGRPKGTKGKSKLDGREQEITGYIDKGISQASISKLLGISPTTLRAFIKSRKLDAGELLKQM